MFSWNNKEVSLFIVAELSKFLKTFEGSAPEHKILKDLLFKMVHFDNLLVHMSDFNIIRKPVQEFAI